MRTLAYVAHDELAILVHGAPAPADAEWADYVAFLKTEMLPRWTKNGSIVRGRVLVLTDGGSPSTLQRKKIQEEFEGQSVPTAVVTASTVARGAVAALSWFGIEIRAFSPEKWHDALTFLNVHDQRSEVFARLVRTCGLVGDVKILAQLTRPAAPIP